MRVAVAALIAGLMAGAHAGGDDKASGKDKKAEQAFKEWGDYFVGGVWTTTNAQGKKEEIRYERILDGAFIRLNWKIGDESREEVYGIDPATGQWTFWGFDSGGRTYKGVAEGGKAGEWTYRAAGHGKNGPNSARTRDVKLGPDEDRFEIQEMIIDGKKLPPEVQVWKRKK
ncbi:MAG: hypothetical protein K2X87_12305 [Gemmataceae bacterium]|nr:hypothetical protein [Gemmataceae bacterium]